jgi:hypothetical protein
MCVGVASISGVRDRHSRNRCAGSCYRIDEQLGWESAASSIPTANDRVIRVGECGGPGYRYIARIPRICRNGTTIHGLELYDGATRRQYTIRIRAYDRIRRGSKQRRILQLHIRHRGEVGGRH